LKLAVITTDFPEQAPVLFGIYQPGNHTYQRILCTIKSINRELTAVNVKKDKAEYAATEYEYFVLAKQFGV
jgi:hypothetical protein